MSNVTSQVSATISSATKEALDRFTEELGLKKNYVVEQALLYFMAAKQELPDEAFIPRRFVLDAQSFDRFVASLEREARPNEALRELMRGDAD